MITIQFTPLDSKEYIHNLVVSRNDTLRQVRFGAVHDCALCFVSNPVVGVMRAAEREDWQSD